MKFDFAIGNPPYQDITTGENDTFAPPVYNKFLDSAYQIADKVEMIHPARFLFNAGSTPKAWNEKMLNDPYFKVMHYEEDASKVFANTDIKGGVAITYHNDLKNFGAIQVFTKYSVLNGILKKIKNIGGIKTAQKEYLYKHYKDEMLHGIINMYTMYDSRYIHIAAIQDEAGQVKLVFFDMTDIYNKIGKRGDKFERLKVKELMARHKSVKKQGDLVNE